MLYFEDCPSWEQADNHLRTLASEMPTFTVRYQIVDTDEAAQLYRFRGSPSIHVDGHDLFADSDTPVGLACRIYQTPSGPAGSPTLDQLRQALNT